MARKPTEYVQFKLRIRESLRRKIEKAAEKKAQSANAEAVERIEQTFEEEERWEAQYKEMEEHRDELDRQQREYYEEQAREKAKYEASLRDSAILDVILKNQPLLRTVARLLDDENNPQWMATLEGRKAIADSLHAIIVNNEFFGDDE